jgi:hypothetical protein
MKPATKLIILSLVFIFIQLVPLSSFAQLDNGEAMTLDTANAFCIKLSKIMQQPVLDFEQAKDSLLDTTGQKAWSCREDYKMPGSNSCIIFKNLIQTTYVAYYLSRGSKDALSASYNNLYHQLKDCLGYKYIYSEKKTTAADRLLGNTVYECEMVPYGDGIDVQADMRISIRKTPDGNYELIMEIMKYTGKYSNRSGKYNDGR